MRDITATLTRHNDDGSETFYLFYTYKLSDMLPHMQAGDTLVLKDGFWS